MYCHISYLVPALLLIGALQISEGESDALETDELKTQESLLLENVNTNKKGEDWEAGLAAVSRQKRTWPKGGGCNRCGSQQHMVMPIYKVVPIPLVYNIKGKRRRGGCSYPGCGRPQPCQDCQYQQQPQPCQDCQYQQHPQPCGGNCGGGGGSAQASAIAVAKAYG